jgi:hypothetical protein
MGARAFQAQSRGRGAAARRGGGGGDDRRLYYCRLTRLTIADSTDCCIVERHPKLFATSICGAKCV